MGGQSGSRFQSPHATDRPNYYSLLLRSKFCSANVLGSYVPTVYSGYATAWQYILCLGAGCNAEEKIVGEN